MLFSFHWTIYQLIQCLRHQLFPSLMAPPVTAKTLVFVPGKQVHSFRAKVIRIETVSPQIH